MKESKFFFKKESELFTQNKNSLVNGIVFVDNMNKVYELTTEINQDIKFIDINNWKVYEHYSVNGQNILNLLGFFDSAFQYQSIIKMSFLGIIHELNWHNLSILLKKFVC